MTGHRRVAVPGGELAVELSHGVTAPVLAVHGVSSNARLWSWLRAEAPEISLIAPDLRGRAGSFEVAGPSSLARHAEDMVAVLDALDLERVTVCGMAMGGFVAVTLALHHPDRVRDLVLVDGGFPMAAAGLTPASVRDAFSAQASLGDRVFGGVDAYRDVFLATPHLLEATDPLLTDYLAHELDRHGRVRRSGEALLADAVETLLHPPAWDRLRIPTRLLAAEWSIGAGSAPAYSDAALDGYRDGLPGLLRAERVAGVDHAASIMTRRGAASVAEQLRAATR